MKKIVFIAIITTTLLSFFTSCKKDDDSLKSTSYQIINNSGKFTSSYEYLDGSFYEVVVFQYNGNDIIISGMRLTLIHSNISICASIDQQYFPFEKTAMETSSISLYYRTLQPQATVLQS